MNNNTELNPERIKRQAELATFTTQKTIGVELRQNIGGQNVRRTNNARDIYTNTERRDEPEKKASAKRQDYIKSLNGLTTNSKPA
jgi:hypothetical protein